MPRIDCHRLLTIVPIGLLVLAVAGCGGDRDAVVVYVALDREFSEPLLDDYAAQLGVDLRAKYDIESTKTVGLTMGIMAESKRPRGDLFWNNEILNTLRLKREGLLQPFDVAFAEALPETFRDPDRMWYGFAARARILLVNTEVVDDDAMPTGLDDLIDPRWRGQIGIAKPLFGTTATHAACLYQIWGADRADVYFDALRENEVQIFSGNRQVSQAVGSGEIAFGLTDTDDAFLEIDAGRPVQIVYPDREPDQLGTLFIPNTLAMIKGAPHPEAAQALAEQIASASTELRLALGPSGQIPLHPDTRIALASESLRVESPETVHPMDVDFEAAAILWDDVAQEMAERFGQ